MTPVIRVDDEVLNELKKRAVGLGLVFEPPNATLRAILGIDIADTNTTEPQEAGGAMRTEVRRRIIEVARRGEMIHYGDIMKEFHIARGRHIANVLGTISEFEAANGRPYLSSIVIRQDTGRPSPDFWGIRGIDRSQPWELYRDEVHRYWMNLSQEEYEKIR